MTKLSRAPSPLSAALLVSKGAARPAAVFGQRGTGYGQKPLFDHFDPAEPVNQPAQHPAPQPQVTDAERAPEETQSQEACASQMQDSAPQNAHAGKKAAFTFRLDETRHLRLRLLSAHENRSAQKILEEALDGYLDSHAPMTGGSNCACFQQNMGL